MALAQIAPVLLDRDATLRKVIDRIEAAASHEARLVVFGETLVPGYPAWLARTDGARFESDRQKDIHARYVEQAVDLSAGDLDSVREAAARRRVYVAIGVAERDPNRGRSLLATAVSIGPDGQILSAHRKLMPTYEERLAWSPGDAHGLKTHALDSFRVGVLNCWENWMPLPRTALYAAGETLHVALWPGSIQNTEPVTRFLAREGRSFVLSVSSVLRAQDVPADFPHREALVVEGDEVFFDGGSAIAAPDGEWLLPPQGGAKEVLLYAELDATQVDRERQNFDPAGHYARPELLELRVRTSRPRNRRDLEEE